MIDILARFEAKVEPEPNSGCHLWTGAIKNNGYGVFWNSKKLVHAHRFAYEQSFGEIPNGLDLDHLCRVRSCVNPSHLEAVPRRTNLIRGQGFIGEQARRTHCPNGHALVGENLVVAASVRGKRNCKECGRSRALKSYYKHKELYNEMDN